MALSMTTLLGCTQHQEGRFSQQTLIEGRDWFPAFTPTPQEAPPDGVTTVAPPNPVPTEVVATVVPEEPTPMVLAAAASPVYPISPPPQGRAPSLGSLAREQMIDILNQAGWPAELHEQAMSVAWCESNFRPDAYNQSGAAGVWQLMWPTWFSYALRVGVVAADERPLWYDPYVNARVARATYLYDIERGAQPWTQWSCKP